MRATIFLHVGMHKTGTSSIQATLFRNRRTLLNHDIHYLSISENHSTALFPLFCEDPQRYFRNKHLGIDTEAAAAKRNAATERAMLRELRAAKASRIVISGEDLLSLTVPGITRLKQKLEPLAGGFRVIVYVREPYSYITSAFGELLRSGVPWARVIRKPPLPNYRRIQNFIDVFGRERVDIRVFDRHRFVDGDLLADFFSAIGADAKLAGAVEAVTANTGLSLEAALILKAVNRQLPRTAKRWSEDRNLFLGDLLRSVPGEPFQCPRVVLRRARPAVNEDLRWLDATLGEKAFSGALPALNNAQPEWSAETLRAIGLLVNALANRADGKNGAEPRAWGRALVDSILAKARAAPAGKP